MQGLHWRLVLVLRHVVRQQCFWVARCESAKNAGGPGAQGTERQGSVEQARKMRAERTKVSELQNERASVKKFLLKRHRKHW